MRTLFTLGLLVCFASPLWAQVYQPLIPEHGWHVRLDESVDKNVRKVIPMEDGGVIVLGTTSYPYQMLINELRGAACWIERRDSFGERMWVRQYGDYLFRSEVQDALLHDGALYILGYNSPRDLTTVAHAWLMKLSTDGDREWIQAFDAGRGMLNAFSGGNLLVVSTRFSPGNSSIFPTVLEISPQGQLLTETVIRKNVQGTPTSTAVVDNRLYFSIWSYSSDFGSTNTSLIGMEEDGTVPFAKNFFSIDPVYLSPGVSGGLLVTADRHNLARFNPDGSTTWIKRFPSGSPPGTMPHEIQPPAPDGHGGWIIPVYVYTGFGTGTHSRIQLLSRVSGSGTLQWTKVIDTPRNPIWRLFTYSSLVGVYDSCDPEIVTLALGTLGQDIEPDLPTDTGNFDPEILKLEVADETVEGVRCEVLRDTVSALSGGSFRNLADAVNITTYISVPPITLDADYPLVAEDLAEAFICKRSGDLFLPPDLDVGPPFCLEVPSFPSAGDLDRSLPRYGRCHNDEACLVCVPVLLEGMEPPVNPEWRARLYQDLILLRSRPHLVPELADGFLGDLKNAHGSTFTTYGPLWGFGHFDNALRKLEWANRCVYEEVVVSFIDQLNRSDLSFSFQRDTYDLRSDDSPITVVKGDLLGEIVIHPGLPNHLPPQFTIPWPVVAYDVRLSESHENRGMVEVYYGGFQKRHPGSKARLLVWDGRQWHDVTRKVDTERETVIGELSRPGFLTVAWERGDREHKHLGQMEDD